MPRFALLLTTFIWGATFPATKAVLEQIVVTKWKNGKIVNERFYYDTGASK